MSLQQIKDDFNNLAKRDPNDKYGEKYITKKDLHDALMADFDK